MLRALTLTLLLSGSLLTGLAQAGPSASDTTTAANSGQVEASGEMAADAAPMLSGTFVDAGCYLKHGGTDGKHQTCAEICVTNGGLVGFLSGEELYLVPTANPMKGPEAVTEGNAQYVGFLNQEVRVEGEIIDKAGMKVLMVTKVIGADGTVLLGEAEEAADTEM